MHSIANLEDTIVALSSAPGPGYRAIIRLTGPSAGAIAKDVFSPDATWQRADFESGNRGWQTGQVHLAGLHSPLPSELFLGRGPHTVTGQDLVEFHTISCPPLIDSFVAQLLNLGARPARPGEFTLRAFLLGKIDLIRAEAILGIIEAGSRDELQQALNQLAGGLSRPLAELRDELLNLLADVEAGLDFADEDIQFVQTDIMLKRLAKGLALITLTLKQIEQRSVAGKSYRVALVGRPNAGKSSLFNALANSSAALVSPDSGTTRDYLTAQLTFDGVHVELIDTAGLRTLSEEIEMLAQRLGQEQACQADLLLLCLESGQELNSEEITLLETYKSRVIKIITKSDLQQSQGNWLLTSAKTGAGITELTERISELARFQNRPALAPSLSRCRHHCVSCLDHLRRAHQLVLNEDPPELLAMELRAALDALGEIAGQVFTDDLLDRIFSRFCIGK